MARQSTHQTKPSPEKSPRRDPTASGDRDAAVNRIASHNYFLLEKFEAGVVLTGTEVKSVRGGLANLKDSYGLVKENAVWLLNAHIGPYEHGNIHNHAPLRTRKLLMHAEEIRKLIGKTQQKGLPDQFADFLCVHQQLSRPQRGVVMNVAVLIGADVSVEQPHGVFFDQAIGVLEVGQPAPDRLDLGSRQNHTRFKFFQQEVVV